MGNDGQVLMFLQDYGFYRKNFEQVALSLHTNAMRVSVFCDYSVPVPNPGSQITVEALPFSRRRIRIGDLVRASCQIKALVRRRKPKLNLFVSMIPIVIGGLWGRFSNTPTYYYFTGLGTVFTADTFPWRLVRFFVIRYMRHVLQGRDTRFIVQNEDDRDYFVRRVKIPDEKVTKILGCGVPKHEFQYDPKFRLGDPIRIFLPARLIRQKGVLELLEASRLLNALGVKHEILLTAGTDPGNPSSLSQSEVKEYLDRNKSISFLGFQEDVQAVYREADIICLPSYREGLPNALVEAAAVGRVIVATDVPGCREVVEHKATGILVEPRSASALVAGLMEVVHSEPLIRRCVENAHERFLARFEQDVIIDQFLSVVNSEIQA